MKKFNILSRLFIVFLLVGCSEDDLSYDNLKNFDIGEYQLQAPRSFSLIEQQGYDSMIGKIEGSGISMSFDYGMYTSPEQNVSEENYVIINDENQGIRRQLLIAKNPQRDNTSIYISSSDNADTNNPQSLKIWSTNLTDAQQELVIKIFNSITVER